MTTRGLIYGTKKIYTKDDIEEDGNYEWWGEDDSTYGQIYEE